jgi:hypothetical protein
MYASEGLFKPSMGAKYHATPFKVIFTTIKKLAKTNQNTHVVGKSVIIGFTPTEASKITENALKSGETWLVGKFNRNKLHM